MTQQAVAVSLEDSNLMKTVFNFSWLEKKFQNLSRFYRSFKDEAVLSQLK